MSTITPGGEGLPTGAAEGDVSTATGPPSPPTVTSPASILGPGGALSRHWPNFEPRPQQLKMAEAVAQAIATKTHLVVEGGTGVGKSLAYLVPAIRHGVPRGLKVIVSTATINLQSQLYHKDLPLLKTIMPEPFTFTIGKGRGQYIGLRRLRATADHPEEFFAEDSKARAQLEAIGHWSRETTDGSLSDLPFKPFHSVWSAVESDASDCLGEACPSRGSCFYFAARLRWEQATVLVVNHALLFTDLALKRVGGGFLPRPDILVIDEAHEIEESATAHLGSSLGAGQVQHLLRRVYHDKGKQETGLVARMKKEVTLPRRETIRDRVGDVEILGNEFFGSLQERLGETIDYQRAVEPWSMPSGGALAEGLWKLGCELDGVAESIDVPKRKQDMSPRDAARRDLKNALKSAAKRAEELGNEIARWLGQKVAGDVYWVERLSRNINLCRAPLEVGPVLKKELFDRVPTCILTSATLGVGTPPRFDLVTTRLGLNGVKALSVGSPFDYQNQCAIHLPRAGSLPDPGKRKEDYERDSIATLPYYLEKSCGGVFVLFTSWQHLKAAAGRLRPWVEARPGWTLFSQDDPVSREHLLEQFRAAHAHGGRPVLLGTDSFWQGVDVPGEALDLVVITRLPFKVPTHPLDVARRELCDQRGGNSFLERTVPEAVIALRQGFGRLIRSASDKGIVVLLDPRVLTKPYGRTFLASLPDCPRVVEAPVMLDP